MGKRLCASVSQQDDAPCLLLSPLLQMALSYCCSERRWPRTGPGWRGSDNAKYRGWVTASCLTFPHCPGLRRAEQIFFFPPWPSRVPLGILCTCGCRKLSQRVINTSSSIVGRSLGWGQGADVWPESLVLCLNNKKHFSG